MDTATLVMAGATFLLAIAAFIGLLLTRKQIAVLSNQLRIQRSQLVPYVTIGERKFEGDEIIVELRNNSDVAAYQLGMHTAFYIVDPRYYSSENTGNELSLSRAKQLFDEGKTVYVNFSLSRPIKERRLIHESNVVVPEAIVNFASDGLPGAILPPQKNASIRLCPLFGVSTIEGNDQRKVFSSIRFLLSGVPPIEGRRRKVFNLTELRDFLLQNDVHFIAVSFYIVYKDVTETPIGSETVATFAVILRDHKSLQEAWEKHYNVDFIPVSMGEVRSKIKYDFADMYSNVRSGWNVPKPLNRL